MICRLSLQKMSQIYLCSHNLKTSTIYIFSIYKYSIKESYQFPNNKWIVLAQLNYLLVFQAGSFEIYLFN